MRGRKLNRQIDFIVGISIILFLYVLGLRFLKKNPLREKNKVAILVFGAIGDAVLVRSITDNLLQRYPEIKITIYLSKENAAAAFLFSNLNVQILKITALTRNLLSMRNETYHVLIDTSQWTRIGAIYSFLSGSKYTIGFQTEGQYRHYLYDQKVIHQNDIHEKENFNNLLIELDIGRFKLPKDSLENLNLEKISITKPCIVLHLIPSGYLSHLREWPADFWIELINRLNNQGYEILVTGSKEDKLKINEILNTSIFSSKVKVIAGEYSLSDTCQIIQKAYCVISVNTSIVHLASLMGVRIISLNGPTNSLRWGAWGPQSINLDVPKELGGCFLNLGFEYPKNPQNIMGHIKVNQVIEAINKFG